MIHAVVVTYQPSDVTALFTELSRQCDAVTVVDNGSNSEAVAALRASCRATGTELVANAHQSRHAVDRKSVV